MLKKVLLGVGIVLVIVVAWVLVSPMFIDREVNEAFPSDAVTGTTNILAMSQYSGTFKDADSFHKGAGVAAVIDDTLRFEKFSVTNGPDLKVYLATDDTANDFIDLGFLKGNIGDQNYEIPPGTDLEKYDTVLIWCRAFSVLFATAELS